MKRFVLLAAALSLATPAVAQPTPATPPLPPGSFHWDGNRKDLKSFEKPTPVTIDGIQAAPARPVTPVTPPPRAPEPEKKPEKRMG